MSGLKHQETLLRATGQVLYECDPDGGEMTFFGDVERLLGNSASELQGSRCQWLQRVHPDDLSLLTKMESDAIEGEPHRLEYRLCHKDGAVTFLRDTCSFVRDENTQRLFLVGALMDITEQRNLLVQFQHIQKKQILGELAGGVAHDFNNLLTIFNGYTELLQSECNPDDPQFEFLAEMANAVERAKALTTQILDFSRDPKSPAGLIQLNSVMLGLCRMLRRIVPENIEWVTRIEEKSGWALAEPRHIEAILINLVLNACDAMPKGGRLCVDVANTDWNKAPCVQIAVSDTGSGMEEAVQARVFEPFFTTKSQRGASGLGLSLCANLVEQIGGKITVESIPGKGSTFRVFLPRVEPPAQKKTREVAKANRVPLGKGESILIVEDDHATQKALAAILKGLKYKVICASNGDEALRVVARNGDIRLVISDLVMPLMGGTELVKKLRKGLPDLKLVLTSGYANPPEIASQKDQQTTFLPKPLSRPVLATKLRELLDV